ncbi:hypothetical protein V6N11_082453 [Hibiscus sabdariffa]|uniref:Uncharacterized protein n=1 Tax=Hibiscus sabdariffa TaxID=183260 RepID=A0ABR2PD38_9ROSI
MDAAGLQGFELVWVAASMVLPSFTTADLCDSLLASKDFCFYAVVFQEAELDRDPTVENQEEFESEMGISPTRVTVDAVQNPELEGHQDSPVAVVGVVGAALVPVLGSVPDGLRKGRGHPVKNQVLIEAGSDVVNASLTDSDI